MELREFLSKKPVKFLTLLLSAMLIASASAAMYYSLTMTSTIQVYEAQVYFVTGSDDGNGGLVVTLSNDDTTATLTGLRAYPNLTFTYTDPVRVRNNASAGNYSQLRLAPVVDPSANPEDFVYVKFLLNSTTAEDRWLNYTSDGSTWTSPTGPTSWTATGINGGEEWPIVVMTMANATATAGQTVTIGITVDVD